MAQQTEVARRQSDGTWLWAIDRYTIATEQRSLRDKLPAIVVQHRRSDGDWCSLATRHAQSLCDARFRIDPTRLGRIQNSLFSSEEGAHDV
jgi:hypothetical protein